PGDPAADRRGGAPARRRRPRGGDRPHPRAPRQARRTRRRAARARDARSGGRVRGSRSPAVGQGRRAGRRRVTRLAPAVATVPASAAPGAVAKTTVGMPPSHPTVRVGGFPTGITVNRSNHTVYVGNGTTGTLSLIDG